MEPHRDRARPARDRRADGSDRWRTSARCRASRGRVTERAQLIAGRRATECRTRRHRVVMCLNVQIRANCSVVGSAQQYQGSLSTGSRRARRACGTGTRAGATAPAHRAPAPSTRANTSSRGASAARRRARVDVAPAARPLAGSHDATGASATRGSNGRRSRARTSGSSSIRDPCGISSRMAQLDRRDVLDQVERVDRRAAARRSPPASSTA